MEKLYKMNFFSFAYSKRNVLLQTCLQEVVFPRDDGDFDELSEYIFFQYGRHSAAWLTWFSVTKWLVKSVFFFGPVLDTTVSYFGPALNITSPIFAHVLNTQPLQRWFYLWVRPDPQTFQDTRLGFPHGQLLLPPSYGAAVKGPVAPSAPQAWSDLVQTDCLMSPGPNALLKVSSLRVWRQQEDRVWHGSKGVNVNGAPLIPFSVQSATSNAEDTDPRFSWLWLASRVFRTEARGEVVNLPLSLLKASAAAATARGFTRRKGTSGERPIALLGSSSEGRARHIYINHLHIMPFSSEWKSRDARLWLDWYFLFPVRAHRSLCSHKRRRETRAQESQGFMGYKLPTPHGHELEKMKMWHK